MVKKIVVLGLFILSHGGIFAMEEALEQFGRFQHRFNQSVAHLPARYDAIEDSLLKALTFIGQNRNLADKLPLEQSLQVLSKDIEKLHADTKLFDDHDLFGCYCKKLNEKIADAYTELEKEYPEHQKIWNSFWRAVAVKNCFNAILTKYYGEFDPSILTSESFYQDFELAKNNALKHEGARNVSLGLQIFDRLAHEKNLSKSALSILAPPISPNTLQSIEDNRLLFGAIEYFGPHSGLVQAKKQGMPASKIMKEADQFFIDHRAQALKPPLIAILKNYGTHVVNPAIWLTNKAVQPIGGWYARRSEQKAKECINAGMEPNKDVYLGLYCHTVIQLEKQKKPSICKDKVSHFVAWNFYRHTSLNAPQLPLAEDEAKKKAQEVKNAPQKLGDLHNQIQVLESQKPGLLSTLLLSFETKQKLQASHELKMKRLQSQIAYQQKLLDENSKDSPTYWAAGIRSTPPEFFYDSFVSQIAEKQGTLFSEFAQEHRTAFGNAFSTFYKHKRQPFFSTLSDKQFAELYFAAQVADRKPLFEAIAQRLSEVKTEKEKAEREFNDTEQQKKEAESRYSQAKNEFNQAKEATGSWLPSFLRYEVITNVLYRFWGGYRKEQEANKAWDQQETKEDEWRKKYHAKEKVKKEYAEASGLKNKVATLQSLLKTFNAPREVSRDVVNGLALHVAPLFNRLLDGSMDSNSENSIKEGPLFTGEIHSLRGSQQSGADCGYYALSHGFQVLQQMVKEEEFEDVAVDIAQIDEWKKKIRENRKSTDADWLEASEIRLLAQELPDSITVIDDLSRIKRGGFEFCVLNALHEIQKTLKNYDGSMSHIFIIGNMNEDRRKRGHWIPVVVHKKDGVISYCTADSLGNSNNPIVDEFKDLLENVDFSSAILDEKSCLEIENCKIKLEWALKIENGKYRLEELDKPDVNLLVSEILESAGLLMQLTSNKSVWTTGGFITSNLLIDQALNIIEKANGSEIKVINKNGKEEKQTINLNPDQLKQLSNLKDRLT